MSFEKKLLKKIQGHWEGTTPSLQIQVIEKGRKKIDIQLGQEYQFYDLASLTKVLFGSRSLMGLYEQKKWSKRSKVKDYIDWWTNAETRIFDLLTHHAGLEWWSPFYKELVKVEPTYLKRTQKLAKLIAKIPIEKTAQCIYSDLDLLSISFVLENIFEKELLEIWTQEQDRWNLKGNLHFRPLFKKEKKDYLVLSDAKMCAPTEDCPWRKKRIQGEVHDENAWSLGGVSTHAGLFGSCDDISDYLLKLRKILLENSKNLSKFPVTDKTVQLFLSRAVPKKRGDWTWGWMMPTKGSSSSGQYFHPSSVGHTGFTGTSLWWDLEKDLMVIILSNRIAMGRENKQFAKLRPFLHDQIIEVLDL